MDKTQTGSSLRNVAEKLHSRNTDYKRSSNIEYVVFLVGVVVFFMAIRLFIAEPIYVSGPSMEPTLWESERVFTEKVSYWFSEPQRGQVIICHYPNMEPYIVKRIIGLPGDTVSIRWGAVYINDEPLDESEYWTGEIYGDMGNYTVPENCVFVMGDNRNFSDDSRKSYVGAIPYYRIVGHGVSVVWPFSDARSLAIESQ